MTGVYRGAEAARDSINDWVGSFEEFSWEAEEFLAAGDQVVVVLRESGRMRGSSTNLDERFAMVFTLKDRKLARLQWFETRDGALAAAGVNPAEVRPTT